MRVFVIGLTDKRLMPTTPCKARRLISSGKAVIYKHKPFTIKLLYKTGAAVQQTFLGVDTGSQHIGIAVTTEIEVLTKAEYQLRSSMEKRSLIEARMGYRRSRRYRKTRYRHPKWKFQTVRRYNPIPDKKGRHWNKVKTLHTSARPEGWLPPSLRSKVNHHMGIIQNYLNVLPDSVRLSIEAGRFDMAHMQNPEVRGILYQQGPLYEWENIKAYVLARDNYICQCCKTKAGTVRKDGSVVVLHVHHLDYKSKGATDNPKGLIAVCTKCHSSVAHEPGGMLYDWMIKHKTVSRGLRDATFMNILRRRMFNAFPDANFTYGNITSADRKTLILSKTHSNDAVAISLMGTGITSIKNCSDTMFYKQVRNKKRSLHEANPRRGRSGPNTTAERHCKNVKTVNGYKLWDTVVVNNCKGFITGFTGTAAYIQDFEGSYIYPAGKTYKQHTLSSIKRVHPNSGWIMKVG